MCGVGGLLVCFVCRLGKPIHSYVPAALHHANHVLFYLYFQFYSFDYNNQRNA